MTILIGWTVLDVTGLPPLEEHQLQNPRFDQNNRWTFVKSTGDLMAVCVEMKFGLLGWMEVISLGFEDKPTKTHENTPHQVNVNAKLAP